MDPLIGALVTWWPVLALLYVPCLAQMLAGMLARYSRSALDHKIPDALPMTAGEWLAERLARRGDAIAALVTNEHRDGYRPGDQLIQLRDETYFKADPVFWSTAAHELGHARIHAEFPIVAILRASAAWMRFLLVAAGIGLLFGRVLYAIPIAGTLAFRCLAIAAALQIFTLVDEALASVLAYRELRESEAITTVHRRAIRWVLATAFSTYLVTAAAYALLLRYWPLVEALAGDHAVRASRLTGLGWTAALACSIGCVAGILARLTWMFAPGSVADALKMRGGWSVVLSLVRAYSIVVLLWLTWDHRVDTTYAWCAIVAFAASSDAWLSLLRLLFQVPDHFFAVWVLSRLPGVHHTSRYVRALDQGFDLVRAGNRRLRELSERSRENPSWPNRILALIKLGYVPLLVAVWLS